MERERFLIMTILWLRNILETSPRQRRRHIIETADRILVAFGDPAVMKTTGEYAEFVQELKKYYPRHI